MKFPRISFLWLAALLLPGCGTYSERLSSSVTKYQQVRVTNIRGELVADWVAEGRVKRTDLGYRFRAVERTSGPPLMTVTRFPHGRRIEVTGANIVVTPAGKPYWLFAMDGR